MSAGDMPITSWSVAPERRAEGRLPVTRLSALVVLVLLCGMGCAPRADRSARPALTERQRDSILARSSLPGAPVVGRALEASTRATRHAEDVAAADSLFR